MRILITGSREWNNRQLVHNALSEFVPAAGEPQPVLVTGACPTGADAIAEEYWRKMGLPVERHPADWLRLGRSAGPRRNQEMVDSGADICLAFPLGESRGTWGCVRMAEKAGIPVVIVG